MAGDAEIIVGIDLGTTFSLVACCDERGPRVIRDASGDGRVPSVVHFGRDGGVTIGWDARAHAVEHPLDTVYSVKRLMGIGLAELQRELPFLSYRVGRRDGNVETPNANSSQTEEPGTGHRAPGTQDSSAPRDVAAVEINGEWLTPQEISALILRELKVRAEQHFGRLVRKAVITVPAYFDDSQRQATRDAGRIAGLEVVRIVNEPTAAALAYGIGAYGEPEERDKGTKGRRDKGEEERYEGTEARRHGGLALPVGDKAKCTGTADAAHSGLRTQDSGLAVAASTIAVYDLGGGTFDVSILRLEEGVFEVLGTHGDTHLGGDDFDRAIITLTQREVQQQFGLSIDSPHTRQALRLLAEQVKIRLSAEPSATIELELGNGRVYRRTISQGEFESLIAADIERTIDACGQALASAKLPRERIDRVVLVGGSSRIPLVRRRVAEFFGQRPYTALNPDEVVALGAAVQAQILAGGRRDLLLLDVTPLSLGIETLGGAMGKLIMANTRVPCRASEMFTTFVDGQANVKVNVLQGERELAADCRSLGVFELRGIPPMPAGIPKIEVTFLIDANGILSVTAREQRSGQEAQIQIIPAHGLTADEVKRMTTDALRFAREDMSAHRLIDLRNQVEFDTHKTEQMLARVGERLPSAEREAIEEGIRVLRRLATTSGDADRIHQALELFDRQTVPLAELAVTAALHEA